MHIQSRNLGRLLCSIALPVLLVATIAAAQTRPAQPAQPARPLAQVQQDNAPIPTDRDVAVPTDRDVAATQSELIKLLRLSPTLTTVVSHDPSLLSNQDYVAHNNPQLAEFLATHPEVARNPEFYLFTHMNREDGGPDEALERAVWPELHQRNDSWSASDVLSPIALLLAFACFLLALTWLVRVFLENRRWGRIFKLQSEVHGRLIDKFSSNQELSSYMETDAGKRFLEASPIPVAFEPSQRMPNAVARVLTPIQIGIVMILLGIGILLLRHSRPELEIPMLVFGTVVLMPGIGFIISAGITWVLATRLGLMPDSSAAPGKFDAPFGSSFTPKDRQ